MNKVIDCDILTYKEAHRLEPNIPPMNILWAINTEVGNVLYYNQEHECTDGYAIRPCLRMDECNMTTGDKIAWLGLTWTYIGNNIWLCDYAVDYQETFDYNSIHDWLAIWYSQKLVEVGSKI